MILTDFLEICNRYNINCAANVKHFSAGTDIEDINVGGTAKGIAAFSLAL